ncbi:sigma-70 family RNA polymerase sigma factor, partial [Myxococcota bacterium]|nr:sigma-70 family RNA polymerase sigma factor [Myxococcota bacterium]
ERITVRTSLRYLRQRRSRETVVQLGLEREGSSFETGENFTDARQMQCVINRLMWQLKPERRMVLVLRFVYRHSIEEIAELTESPVNTVRDRLRVGKAKLMKLMRTDPAMRDWIEESSL